jgi:branched-chain amino acid transport system ATP-binding protein
MTAVAIAGLGGGYGESPVLHDVTLDVAEGEIFAILGKNGMGKTTLMKTAMGFLRPTRGSIAFEGAELTRLTPHEIARRGVGLVPENRRIFSGLTVRENLELGLSAVRTRSAALRAERLDQVFHHFPRLAERIGQTAKTLSGGEQQMLALARALMGRPRLLLLDEPSLGLAPLVVREIFRIVRTINRERGVSVLLVEQNASIALNLADHAYLIETGRVVRSGPAAELRQDEAVRRAYLGY